MADPLYDLLKPHLHASHSTDVEPLSEETLKYLSRLVSLRLGDLTTTEPQSITQSTQSNIVSIQALSSRSHRTTTTSSDHLATLRSSLPILSSSVEAIRSAVPDLDASAVEFASSYSRSKDESGSGNVLLNERRESALLARQADKAQDILELPSLLSAAIASANTSSSATSGSGANYAQALDLFAHIKRLQILYPDSQLVRSVLADAEIAMRDMTTNLIASLRGQNIRLAAAIRMIGWLRRVAPELSTTATIPRPHGGQSIAQSQFGLSAASSTPDQDEGHFGALFLCARLSTFLTMTEALSPLRDLADQETLARKAHAATTEKDAGSPQQGRKSSTGYNPLLAGQQTERYLKRYIEIFREQSFATISMYRNVFPADDEPSVTGLPDNLQQQQSQPSISASLGLPPALQSFPLHLVDLFTSTLKEYLPNVTDPTARESLLMQVLYAANSLGRLGADFSLMIATLDEDEDEDEDDEEADEKEGALKEARPRADVSVVHPEAHEASTMTANDAEQKTATTPKANGAIDKGHSPGEEEEEEEAESHPDPESTEPSPASHVPDSDTATRPSEPPPAAQPESVPKPEPEWVAAIKKHRVQAARLEALAAGQEVHLPPRRGETSDVVVR